MSWQEVQNFVTQHNCNSPRRMWLLAVHIEFLGKALVHREQLGAMRSAVLALAQQELYA